MADKFRIGIIGAGMITQGSHLPAALASEKVVVTALVDPVVDRAKGLARSYGISPLVSASVEDVLGRIDGAIIATPNNTHHDIAVTCLRAGISTLIEKPLASTMEEGKSILAAAQATGATVAVGYYTRYWESTFLLKELLEQEYFGRVHRFVHQFGTAGGWAPFSAYNLRRATAGGGVMVVTATHFLDRMIHFFGYPSSVAMEDDSLGGPESNCEAVFKFERSGTPIDGMIRYSKTFRLPGGLVIDTDEGVVVIPEFDGGDLVLHPKRTPSLTHTLRRTKGMTSNAGGNMFLRQIDDFVDACLAKRKPFVDGEQAMLSLKLIESLYGNRHSVAPDWYDAAMKI